MKKNMKIQVYTMTTEPEDVTPFSMVFGSVWKLFDAGELNLEKLAVYCILYRFVNPYEGIGRMSYAKICTHLKWPVTKQNVNSITKIMKDLKEEELIWFPKHSGNRDFAYVVAKFKLAKIEGNKSNQQDRWIDITRYFSPEKQNESRGNESALPTPPSDPMPRYSPPEQRSERSNSGGIKSIRDVIRERGIRPPQTDTNTQT